MYLFLVHLIDKVFFKEWILLNRKLNILIFTYIDYIIIIKQKITLLEIVINKHFSVYIYSKKNFIKTIRERWNYENK